MSKAWLTFVQEIGDLFREIFLTPGDMLIAASGIRLVGDNHELLFSVAISATAWLSLLICARALVRLGQRLYNRASLAIRSRWFLLKTRLTRRKVSVAAGDRTHKADSQTEVTLSDLDLAVLSSAAELEQGFAMSAPDLAARFELRPTKVQSSLEKLSGNMLLERTLGSTDDYENYQLTRAGAAFLSMWQRND